MGLLTVLAAGFTYYPLVLTAKPAGAATIGGERALAAQLAAQINSQGNRMSLLAEQYDQATIKAHQISGQLAQAQRTLARTQDRVNKIQVELRHQAVAAYVQDGSVSQIQALLQSNESDVALKQHYLATAAGDEQSTVDSLNLARQALDKKKAALVNAKSAADTALATVSGAQRSAASEAAQEHATLTKVKGTLATLVQQAQERQAAAQAQRVQAALATQAATAQAAVRRSAASPDSVGKSNPSKNSTGGGNPHNVVRAVTRPVAKALPRVGGGLIGPNANAGAASAPAPSVAGGAATAIAWAQREIGKNYVFGGAGPDVFDCSGLTMYVWGKAGVSLPHSAAGQWDATTRVPMSQIEPGDLIFYYTPIDHVGLYVGGGQMIVADHTGTQIRYDPIFRPGLDGAGRP